MLKSITFGIGCVFIWVIIALTIGCGGEGEGAYIAPTPDNGEQEYPLCTNDGRCPCDAPRMPCWAKAPGRVLVCYEGFYVSLEDIGTFENAMCHPETDAGTSPEASPTEDSGDEADSQVGEDAEVDSEVDAEADAQPETSVDAAKNGTLSITLAQNPVSSVFVKKQQMVAVLGIEFKTDDHDMLIKELPIQCNASKNGAPYTDTECSSIVTSIALHDGAQQVGDAQLVEIDGKAKLQPNYFVPNNTSKTLIAKITLSSTVSMNEPYDRIAFGIPAGVVVQDMATQTNVTPDVSVTISDIQLSQTPVASHIVRPFGTLSVEYVPEINPATMAGGGLWTLMAKYRATAQYEEVEINRANLYMPADLAEMRSTNEDCSQIGVGTLDSILGTAIMPVGQYGQVDVDLSLNPITVPKNDSIDFYLWCMPAIPVPSITAGFTSPRTGDSPALGLNHSLQVGEWNSNYHAKANLRTVGRNSGERIYADAVAEHGPFMILRGNNMFVTKLMIPSTNLQLGEMPAYNFSVMVSPMGTSMSISQFAFNVQASPGVKFRPRLYKGNQYADAYGYSYSKGASEPCDNENGNHCFMGNHQFLFRFYTEQVITPGNTIGFTLALTINKLPAGSSHIDVNFVKQGEAVVGQVINLTCHDIPDSTLGLGLSYDQYSRPGIIASDMTEIPHLFPSHCSGDPITSSSDFFGDYLLLDHLTANTFTN
jgi:hypothetical protein